MILPTLHTAYQCRLNRSHRTLLHSQCSVYTFVRCSVPVGTHHKQHYIRLSTMSTVFFPVTWRENSSINFGEICHVELSYAVVVHCPRTSVLPSNGQKTSKLCATHQTLRIPVLLSEDSQVLSLTSSRACAKRKPFPFFL